MQKSFVVSLKRIECKMGRTKRKRLRKLCNKINNEDLFGLQKYLKLKSKHLKISYFSSTGRGIKCKRKLAEGDILIALPIHRLITSKSLCHVVSFLINNMNDKEPQLTLSIFLMYEQHLGSQSKYITYLKTLPKEYSNLFFCEPSEIKLLPEFLKETLLMQKKNLKNKYDLILQKMENSICPHCSTCLSSFFTEDRFYWAWFTVNTRSVYYKVC